jgi:hypothetical protein
VPLSEEDAVAEEGEACSSVHLAGDPLGLGVDALGGAVAVAECERGDHGVEVSLQPSGEGMQVRQIGSADLGDPELERVGIVWVRLQELGEVPDTERELGHLGAGRDEPVQ